MNCILCDEPTALKDNIATCPSCKLHKTEQHAEKSVYAKKYRDERKPFRWSFAESKKYYDLKFAYCKPYIKHLKSVLDVGCGYGQNLQLFKDKGHLVMGIDPDHNTVLEIKKNMHLNAVQGYFEDYLFEEKFDLIWFNHIFEHSAEPEKILKKAKSLLKKDGMICIIVPDCENPRTLDQSTKNKHHIFHYTQLSLRKLLEQSNLNIIQMNSFGLLPKNLYRFGKLLCRINENYPVRLFPYYPYQTTYNNDGIEIIALVA